MSDPTHPVRALMKSHASHSYPHHPERHTVDRCPLCQVRALLDAGDLAQRVECTSMKCRDGYTGEGKVCSDCHGTGKVWRPL